MLRLLGGFCRLIDWDENKGGTFPCLLDKCAARMRRDYFVKTYLAEIRSSEFQCEVMAYKNTRPALPNVKIGAASFA